MTFFDSDPGFGFVIGFTHEPRYDFGIFTKGYRLAASKLAEALLSIGNFRDYEAYPVVFLYRHAFELHLKNIIYKSARLSFFKQLADFELQLWNQHKLPPLAKKAVTVLQKLFPDNHSLEPVLQKLEKSANEFAEIDPDSYSYRYPVDTKGQQSTKPHQGLSLKGPYITMDALLDELEVIDFGLDVETDQAEEIWQLLQTGW